MNRSNAVDFIKRQSVTGRGMANTDSKFIGALSTVQAQSTGPQPTRRRGNRDRRREALAGYLFISPWIIGFLLFTLGAMIYSLVISFTRVIPGNAVDNPTSGEEIASASTRYHQGGLP